MSDDLAKESMLPDAASSPPADAEQLRADRARRWYRMLLSLAILSLAVAIALNWWRYPGAGGALPGPRVGSPSSAIPAPGGSITLDKNVLDLLPTRVLQYETITHQAVPGAEKTAAEALYKTLNMNIAAQVDVTVYARAEGTISDAAARSRLDELMRPYPLDSVQTKVGGTVATAGWAENGSSYLIGWTRGQYVTIVKGTYVDFTPAVRADQIKYLEPQTEQVAKGVEEYQRLGKGGLRK